MLPYHGLKSVMSKLRFKDETALRGLGLNKLVRTYDAYPVQEGSRRLFCLLPRGMAPATAQKFEKEAAARQIIVLEKAGDALSKIWPGNEGDIKSASSEKLPQTGSGPAPELEDVLKFVEE